MASKERESRVGGRDSRLTDLHVRRLQEGLAQIPSLRELREKAHDAAVGAWEDRVRQSLESVFGTQHHYVRRFRGLSFWATRFTPPGGRTWSRYDQEIFDTDLQKAQDVLRDALEEIRVTSPAASHASDDSTGWPRVDRDLQQMRRDLEQAQTESQFQAVGLYSREILITLAQIVYDPSKHRTPDGITPSSSDTKRLLEAFLATELQGEPNEAIRKHARAALDVANDLQHPRTATFRSAALCAEATASVVNLITIISGRRDQG